MARPNRKKNDGRFEPSAEARRFQSLNGGAIVRLFSPDGRAHVVGRGEAASLIAAFDADDRTPGWIERDMRADPERWADVLEALVALNEEASHD
jgi:hypothetical protein